MTPLRVDDAIRTHIAEASRRFRIPAAWIWAVMQPESAGDVRARSKKGAMRLMQIMPATWILLRNRQGLGDDPYDPRDNILAGAAYLRDLHDRYGTRGFLAASNAGPGRYEDHLAGRRSLPAEIVDYVSTVGRRIDSGVALDAESSDDELIAAHRSALFLRLIIAPSPVQSTDEKRLATRSSAVKLTDNRRSTARSLTDQFADESRLTALSLTVQETDEDRSTVRSLAVQSSDEKRSITRSLSPPVYRRAAIRRRPLRRSSDALGQRPGARVQ